LEEEGGEEADEADVDLGNLVDPHVDAPSDDPEAREKTLFNLL